MSKTTSPAAAIESAKAECKRLARLLADETQPEQFAAPIRAQLAKAEAALSALVSS